MKLPIVSANKVIKALSSVGFGITRQSGSHVILVKHEHGKKITVECQNIMNWQKGHY